jgi:hypothetical protein
MHMMVQRPIRFNSPPLEVYTKIQSEVAERAQRGKKGNSYRKPTEVVGCLLIASDGSVGGAAYATIRPTSSKSASLAPSSKSRDGPSGRPISRRSGWRHRV